MVTIAKQFNGPPASGNGGYASGVVAGAREHRGPVEVRLTTPPPLDTPLTFENDPEESRLVTHGGALVGLSRPGEFSREAPRFADAAEIEAGRAAYPGFADHPFDHCFTCGTRRGEGDGLRIFSGPIAEGITSKK